MRSSIQFILASVAIATVGFGHVFHATLLHLSEPLTSVLHMPCCLLLTGFLSLVFAIASLMGVKGRLISPKWFFPFGGACILICGTLSVNLFYHAFAIKSSGISGFYFDAAGVYIYLLRDLGQCTLGFDNTQINCVDEGLEESLSDWIQRVDPEPLDDCLAQQAINEQNSFEPRTKQAQLFLCLSINSVMSKWGNSALVAAIHELLAASLLMMDLVFFLLIMFKKKAIDQLKSTTKQ